jgi:hypothetical protein
MMSVLVNLAKDLLPEALVALISLARAAVNGAGEDELLAAAKRLAFYTTYRAAYRRGK